MIGTAWVFCLVGWVYVIGMPDQYQASARVYVDTSSILKPLLRGLAIDTNERHRISMMTKTLFSRPNMEKLARMTDLDLHAKTPEELDKLLDRLESTIELSGGLDNLYTISYLDEEPEMAKMVVKSLLTLFVQGNLGESRKDQDAAHQFLEQQIKEYEARMVEAETRATRFKQENIGFFGGEGGNYYSRLSRAKDQLTGAKLDLKMQQDRLKVLRTQLEDEKKLPPRTLIESEKPSVDSVPSEMDIRISTLEMKLDELLLRYTDQHPDVIGVRRTIETLKSKQQEAAAMAKADLGVKPEIYVPENSAVYQQMKLVYSEAEADVASKKTMVHEYRNRVKNLEKAVDRVLKVETKQSQLNRDYGSIKKNYAILVAQLEKARMTRKVDTQADTIRFRVIDPPRVPFEPSGPNRTLFSSGVLLVGLGLGIALAFLWSQFHPVFDDRRLMSETLGLPVLGSVDMIWTREQKKNRMARGFAFFVAFFGLLVAYGGVMSLYLFAFDAGSLFDQARSHLGVDVTIPYYLLGYS